MKLLTLDTSSVTACAGVVDIDGDVILSEQFSSAALTHSQTVLPMTEAALAHAALTMNDIDALAVVNGPGSFTGVRIGVAAAKGLGFERELLCAPVSTLEALSLNFEGVPLSAVICAVMDARCRQVYTATFSCEDGAVTRLTPDEAMSVDDCKAALAALGRPVIFVGDGALLCEAAMKDELDCAAAPPHLRFVRPRGIALAAAREKEKWIPASELQPMYLRLPQAERELKARQALKA